MAHRGSGTAGAWWRRWVSITATESVRGHYPVTFVSSIATCVLAPAYTIRWHLGPLPTTVLENAILVTIAVFAVESLRQGAVPVWRSGLVAPGLLAPTS